MEAFFDLTFIKEHLLAVIAFVTTLIFVYHYIIEKEHGVKLSKRYRDNIFETQSKIFLNATQYLISGNKDLAIREFLNAVDLNRETLETYFALGGLFRSNGEIDKSISIHRSIIARENINEITRLRALKELAFDFDKGGFMDKAIETYNDVLKINRDQEEVILALCRIYEDIEDWDQAFNHRVLLSKVGQDNQAETISHILVEKAKTHFHRGDFTQCQEDLEDALRYAPSVSAKILKLKIHLVLAQNDSAAALLEELIREHPMYTSFVFVELDEFDIQEHTDEYFERLALLKKHFLSFRGEEFQNSPSVVLSQIRLLKSGNKAEEALEVLTTWMDGKEVEGDVLKIEYIKLLIELNKKDEVITETEKFLGSLHGSLARHYCSHCGYNSDSIFWRCVQCHRWETIQFRWKV